MPLFRRKSDKTSKESPQEQQVQCSHPNLAPRWDSVADMGNKEKISRYECAACHARFSREEGEALIQKQQHGGSGLSG